LLNSESKQKKNFHEAKPLQARQRNVKTEFIEVQPHKKYSRIKTQNLKEEKKTK